MKSGKNKKRKKGITRNPAIVFAEVEDAWELEYLKKHFQNARDVRIYRETAGEILPKIQDAGILSVFIKSRIDKALLQKIPQLRLVTTRSTGFDHIDLQETRKKKIAVCNVPTYGENTVAEHAFALILSLSRNLRKAYLRTMRNDFSIQGLMGFDLRGKTLGVVGTGHIGLHVIRMGTGFGMNVLACDVKRQQFLSEVMNFKYVTFEEILAQSDILTLHVPYMPATHHLIHKGNIKKIKKGAVLINTSRGGLVETEALIRALNEGILAGAGLDVLEEEAYILEENRFIQDKHSEEYWLKQRTILENHVLLHRENVIYTPHMAFYSQEAVQRILDTTVENIFSYLNGKKVNAVG